MCVGGGYQPSAQPLNLKGLGLLSGFTPLGRLALPFLKSSPCPIVGHTSSGSSARACPGMVTLPGAYAPAGTVPIFLLRHNPPPTHHKKVVSHWVGTLLLLQKFTDFHNYWTIQERLVGFGVFVLVSPKMTVFWVVMHCSLVEVYQYWTGKLYQTTQCYIP